MWPGVLGLNPICPYKDPRISNLVFKPESLYLTVQLETQDRSIVPIQSQITETVNSSYYLQEV